ncbi:hypothetical protein BKA82DRAFT_131167, partial [Pisolithus tinctorius]
SPDEAYLPDLDNLPQPNEDSPTEGGPRINLNHRLIPTDRRSQMNQSLPEERIIAGYFMDS